MRLHLGEFDGQTAGALLRWTLNKKEIEQAKANAKYEFNEEVYILITILHLTSNTKFNEEKRLLLPLTQMATYISFRNPGQHLILAGIIKDNDYYSQERLMDLHAHHHGYEVYVHGIVEKKYPNDKCIFSINPSVLSQKQASRLTVNVGAELFAPKPWDFNIINSWFDTEPINECQHRRRRLFAWPATIVWLMFHYTFGLALAIFIDLVVGVGGVIGWNSFKNPFGNDYIIIKYFWGFDGKNCYLKWFQNPDGSRKTLKEFFCSWRTIILESILLVTIVSNWEVISYYSLLCFNLLKPINGKVGIMVIIGFFIVLALVLKLGKLLSSMLITESGDAKGLLKILEEMSVRRWEKREQKRRALIMAELEALSPENLPKEITLETLPPKKITFWLELMKWKKDICRPFSGR